MDTMGAFIDEFGSITTEKVPFSLSCFFPTLRLVSSGLWSSHVWNLKADKQNGRKMLSPRGQDSSNKANALCHSHCKHISLLLL